MIPTFLSDTEAVACGDAAKHVDFLGARAMQLFDLVDQRAEGWEETLRSAHAELLSQHLETLVALHAAQHRLRTIAIINTIHLVVTLFLVATLAAWLIRLYWR